MTCACGTQSLPGKETRVLSSLNLAYEFLGMPMLAERFEDICGVAGRALEAVTKAERANAIGLFSSSSDRSLAEAVRQRNAAVRMLRSFTSNLEERLKSTAWTDALSVIGTPDSRQGNPSDLLDELSASVDDQLMSSSLAPEVCREVKIALQQCIVVGKQGIKETMTMLSKSIKNFETELLAGDIQMRINRLSGTDNAASNVEAKTGREPQGAVGEYLACTAAATAVFVAAVIGCAYIPYCWCCIAPLLFAGFVAWVSACENIQR